MRASVPLGQLGISEGLRAFVEELPFERRPILDFVMSAASELSSGAEVVDIGAGDAPDRELFSRVRYRTVDWSECPHEGGRTSVLIDALSPSAAGCWLDRMEPPRVRWRPVVY